MDLKEIFKTTKTTYPIMLSEYMEMQYTAQGVLKVIIIELAKNDAVKGKKLFDNAQFRKEKESERVVASLLRRARNQESNN